MQRCLRQQAVCLARLTFDQDLLVHNGALRLAYADSTCLQSLLTDPNPASPANPDAAQLYQNDRPAYNKRVRKCAQRSVDG
jgi:hypothetical protein